MANFVAIVDPDPERRAKFLSAIEPSLPPMDGLVTRVHRHGDLAVAWAAHPAAPTSVDGSGDACAVIWGHAIDGTTSARVSASDLAGRARDGAAGPSPPYDGYYAALTYRRQSGIAVWADLLGLFPVYYASLGGVLLVGSSPELFPRHPAFRPRLDVEGLVAILLTTNLLEGRTLFEGVRRLGPGHALVWDAERGPRELPHYRLPVSDRPLDLPFSAQANLLGDTLSRAVRRHVPAGSSCSLLLSGGRDSRMLAGFLKDNGVAPVTLTLGVPTDFEIQCAAPVARSLGFAHRTGEIEMDGFPRYADLEVTWGHGAYGFNLVPDWGFYRLLRELPPLVVSAYIADPIVGGTHLTWSYSETERTMSFARFFERINAYGIRVPVLRRLLRREVFGDLIDQVGERIRARYQSYSNFEWHRAWCFDLHHRQRFHSGSDPWRFSFGAWPVMPVVDREVLELAGRMPVAALAERRAQDKVICDRFPRLAEVPVDRNSAIVDPIQPSLGYVLAQNLRKHLRPVTRLTRWRRPDGAERRRYFRLFDLNGPAWMTVRAEADRFRSRVTHLFDEEALDAILPRAPAPVPFRDGIIDFSGPKSLVGFLLWSERHLR